VNFKVLGIGEVLWDLLPGGRQIGGAPANFTYHTRALGADAQLISRVGDDMPGRDLLSGLAELGVPATCIAVDEHAATGTVTVNVATDGQPCFVIHENVAWDAIGAEPAALNAASEADAVCFGTLAQRSEASRRAIQQLVATTRPSSLRILDVNLRQHYFTADTIGASLELANILKVNDAELPRIAEIFAIAGDTRTQIARLADRFELQVVAFTRGARGSWLYSSGGWSECDAASSNVVDTVGAGDAFTAAMTLGLLSRWNLDRVNQLANEIAAFVCSRPGGTPVLPSRFDQMFRNSQSA
jgi:fructokinase